VYIKQIDRSKDNNDDVSRKNDRNHTKKVSNAHNTKQHNDRWNEVAALQLKRLFTDCVWKPTLERAEAAGSFFKQQTPNNLFAVPANSG
jgi:hypothetical protein